MARELHADAVTALQTSVIRPVLLVRLDILSDPLTAWTGPGLFAPTGTGDAALDDQIFAAAAPIVNLSEITEDKGIGGPVTLTVSGHALDEDLLRQIVRDKRQWRGRDAWLWMALLDDDQKTVISNPFRIKTGVITSITTLRAADEAVVQVTIDRDLGNAKSAPFRLQDHPRFWPSDTFATFMVTLANKPRGFSNVDMPSGDEPNPELVDGYYDRDYH